MAEISIIIPVYNVERYLERCVNSILEQTFSDFELILVNDGSQDRSGDICDEYAKTDSRVHVIHQKNGGQAAAKNAGIDFAYKESDSRWIAFIDSDDWIHPAYFESLYHAATHHHAEIAVCDIIKTDGSSELPQYDALQADTVTPEALWLSHRMPSIIPVCKLCTKKVFQGYRFPVGRVHEDEFILYRVLFSCKKIAYIDAQLYYYYQNPQGITLQKQWTPERADGIEAISEQCDFFHRGGFYKAENYSAMVLFIGCAEVLNNLLTLYPAEKRLIRHYRTVFQRTWRKYRAHLDYSMVGSKKNYMRLAHPVITKLRRKGKHALIFIRRLFHA